jgi:ABC-type glutathione transport system ATPase component
MPTHAVLIDRREQRKEEQKLANSIADRLSEELVFALVGPVGSGVSTAGKYIAEILTQDYGYAVAPVIKPSEIIKAEAHRVGRQNIDLEPLTRIHRMTH